MDCLKIINIICNIITSIGTLGAVIVALFYSHKAVSKKKKLKINRQFSEHFLENYIKLTITIENIGNTPVILSKYGYTDGKEKDYFYEDLNKYILNKKDIILINPNQAELIEYRYDFKVKFSESMVHAWRETNEYKKFLNIIFYAEDTSGQRYPEELYKGLKKHKRIY